MHGGRYAKPLISTGLAARLADRRCVPALIAYNAGMQYTLRNIPKKVDQALRKKARQQGRSLNEVAIEALAIATGAIASATPVKRIDVSDIAGTWIEDPEFDAIMAEQDQIDPEMWK